MIRGGRFLTVLARVWGPVRPQMTGRSRTVPVPTCVSDDYTKRNGHEAVRRKREKLPKTEFDARADIIELVVKVDAARKRRHDGDLSGEERDNAGREEDQLRRKWHDLWNTRRTGDDRYTRAERDRSELNRPISEREAALRSSLRQEGEVARQYDRPPLEGISCARGSHRPTARKP